MDPLEQLRQAISGVVPVGLERSLYPVTAYVILPLFARFNRGVLMDSGDVNALIPWAWDSSSACSLASRSVITAASWIVIRFGLAEMPSGVNSGQIHGSAIRAGVGFTMSLFVSDLAFGTELLIRFSKVGIRAGSALCVAVGYYVLRSALELEARPSKRAMANIPVETTSVRLRSASLKKEE